MDRPSPHRNRCGREFSLRVCVDSGRSWAVENGSFAVKLRGPPSPGVPGMAYIGSRGLLSSREFGSTSSAKFASLRKWLAPLSLRFDAICSVFKICARMSVGNTLEILLKRMKYVKKSAKPTTLAMRLNQHSKHHTKQHMQKMKEMIRHGASFAAAHRATIRKVGK